MRALSSSEVKYLSLRVLAVANQDYVTSEGGDLDAVTVVRT